MKIKVSVLRKYGKVSIEEINLTLPKEKEVLVKIALTGFCLSDLNFHRSGF